MYISLHTCHKPSAGGNAAGRLLRLPRAGLLFDNPGARATVFSYPIADPERLGICHLAEEVRASPDGEPVRRLQPGSKFLFCACNHARPSTLQRGHVPPSRSLCVSVVAPHVGVLSRPKF